MQEEVNGILKSINETTERDITLIEERERVLKNLLAEIEKRLKTYIREMETRREAEDAYAALGQKNQAASVPPARSQAAYEELGRNRYRGIKARQEEAPQSTAAVPQEEKSPPPEIANPAFPLPSFTVNPDSDDSSPGDPPSTGEQIRELIRAGFTAPVIASRLGISISQVEFAEALLERREAER